jgi:xanthine dehydrogenase small subunit
VHHADGQARKARGLPETCAPITVEAMGDSIQLVLNDQPVTIANVSPMTTLLDWLREHRGLKGTKEGCAEGDCGACTVVLEHPDGRRAPINSCIALLGQIDGAAVRTVEGLRGAEGGPHPLQIVMAESDATQCGFCTPGFVMSAYAFAAGDEAPAAGTIHDALAGNLCRCTGYRPIVQAMTTIAGLPIEPPPRAEPRATSASFGTFHAPRSLAELLVLRAAHPDALLLAGATDLGLLASRSRKPPAQLIHVAHVPELTVLHDGVDSLTIGAAVTYVQAMPLLVARYPALGPYLSRLGSRQIRTMGTLGGNIGTASPIGDMPPVLIALEASVSLASTRGVRVMPLEEFFVGYRKTALAPDEVIAAVSLPKLWTGEVFFCDKLSKRRDQDISTVAAGYRLRLEDGRISDVRVGFGGMAATPKRAIHVEQVLKGQVFSAAAFEAAANAVSRDFQPIDDWRGSAVYRLGAAANLLRRLYWRIAEPSAVVEVEGL